VAALYGAFSGEGVPLPLNRESSSDGCQHAGNNAESNTGPVIYHGIIYTICRGCNEVIGSGMNEAILLAN